MSAASSAAAAAAAAAGAAAGGGQTGAGSFVPPPPPAGGFFADPLWRAARARFERSQCSSGDGDDISGSSSKGKAATTTTTERRLHRHAVAVLRAERADGAGRGRGRGGRGGSGGAPASCAEAGEGEVWGGAAVDVCPVGAANDDDDAPAPEPAAAAAAAASGSSAAAAAAAAAGSESKPAEEDGKKDDDEEGDGASFLPPLRLDVALRDEPHEKDAVQQARAANPSARGTTNQLMKSRQRAFRSRFAHGRAEPFVVLTHHNGVQLVGLAPGHPVEALCRVDGWRIEALTFLRPLRELSVQGKKKKGQVHLAPGALFAVVTLVRGQQDDDAQQQRLQVGLHAAFMGHVLEINRTLLDQPQLMVTDPRRLGYLFLLGQTRGTARIGEDEGALRELMDKSDVSLMPAAEYSPDVLPTLQERSIREGEGSAGGGSGTNDGDEGAGEPGTKRRRTGDGSES